MCVYIVSSIYLQLALGEGTSNQVLLCMCGGEAIYLSKHICFSSNSVTICRIHSLSCKVEVINASEIL